MSRRIFELARDQQEEIDMPEDDSPEPEDERESFKPRVQFADDDDDDSDDDDMSDNGDAEDMFVSAF
jgi:essential nuclear protein 1